jgi:predicted site-specific integrase-resolvase
MDRNSQVNKRWLTIKDFCVEFGIGRSTLHRWCDLGRGPVFKKMPNGQLRVSREELIRWTSELAEVA